MRSRSSGVTKYTSVEVGFSGESPKPYSPDSKVKRLILCDTKEYYSCMRNPKRTALLIHCSVEEAQQIRAAARKQDRTISGYVMRVLRNRLQIERQIEERDRNAVGNYLQRTGWDSAR